MDFTTKVILIGSALLLVSILASIVSARLGAPILLVFLVLGMLAGEDGPGGIAFDDVPLSHLVGNLALSVILFDGGVRTRIETFRIALWPAVSLATVGVIVTALIVAGVTVFLLDLTPIQGLLMGAIVGSTDAAAVFSLLHAKGLGIKQRVAATLEVESGSNDPMAIFLTITLIALLTQGRGLDWTLGLDLIQQFAIGGIACYFGGRLLVWVLNRLDLATGLYPLLALVGAIQVFSATTAVGGSGFLAIYIVGIVLGNSPLQASQNIFRVSDGLAWLSQIGMFLILGLLVTPSELIPLAFEASIIALVLIFVARPVAVWISLVPFHFPWREQTFIAWVGLRGAVPIVLSLFVLLAGHENARLFFNIAFFVVILSLALQGWTIALAARTLRLEIPPTAEPMQRINLDVPGDFAHEFIGYRILPGSFAEGRNVKELPLPPQTYISAILRDGSLVTLNENVVLQAKDYLYVTAAPDQVAQINRLFDPHQVPAHLAEHQFFGDFILDGEASVRDIEDVYGINFARAAANDTLDMYLGRRFHKRPVVGDTIQVGRVYFVVREMEGAKIKNVGMRIQPDRRSV